jgi:diaminobutyrate-2-oxoglutarate transaminase
MNLIELHFPEAPRVNTAIPGPRSQELLRAQERMESRAFKYSRTLPIALEEGRGATLKDVDGNIFIDLFAGIGVANVGHSNPLVLKAAQEQAEKLVHALDFPAAPRIQLMEKLQEIAPGELKGSAKVLFGGPTGADAIEGAIKLAKYNTKKHALIAFRGSYHGQSTAALSVTSGEAYKQNYLPLLPDVHFMPYPYSYRCPFGERDDHDCADHCLQYLEDALKDPYSGIASPAAIIVEPIQGESGVIVPPKHFLRELKRLAHDHDVLLIVDEIQTGFGRTGRMFACEHSDTTPDVITLAKAIGGIGYPLASCLYRENLDTWQPGAHIGTFRGHLVAMAAGAAAIDFLKSHQLAEHSAELGQIALQRLRDLQEEIPQIGEVRAKGLFIGIEFVKDRHTREPAPEIVQAVQRRCLEKGVLVWTAGHYGNVIRLIPPLVITEALLHKGLDVLEETVHEVVKVTSAQRRRST